MTIPTSDELKESAYAIRTLAGATHHYQYVAMCMLGAAILDTIATVSADEPERNQSAMYDPNTDTESTVVNAQYADHWRNKAMQLKLDVEAWKVLVENCQESQRGYKEENELLRKAAQDVLHRWDSPKCKDQPSTATFINALRDALGSSGSASGEPT